ncbi:MAG: substrate-binding domain-containing protein [Phycisphaeraceae bacterium]|nr:substrate-binding domain-containing protein [Phycisphaeraceae bacterium]
MQKVIALVGLGESGLDARIRKGIHAYIRPHRPWRLIDGRQDRSLWARVEAAKIDGLITHLTSEDHLAQARSLGCPIVNLANVLSPLPAATVTNDDRQIGRLAADFFIDRKFAAYGMVTDSQRFRFDIERAEGFTERLAELDLNCSDFALSERDSSRSSTDHAKAERDALMRWLGQLPRPAAVFASRDRVGAHILEHCAAIGLSVPDTIAVIGVDDSEVICETCDPPLASVSPAAETLGFEAVKLLETLMDGQSPPQHAMRIRPQGVTSRLSADVFAIENAKLRTALRFIHQHATERISVADVVRHLGVDRRWLERHFARELQRTVFQEIQRVQVEQAKRFLASTDVPMSEVAQMAGFRDSTHMGVVFRRLLKVSPMGYRRADSRGHARLIGEEPLEPNADSPAGNAAP